MISRFELKDLETERDGIESELKKVKEDIKERQRHASSLSDQIRILKERIESSSKNGLIVSEHAIVRYIERVMGLNIEAVINDIKSNDLVRSADSSGIQNTKIKTKNGYTVVIKNGVIVTVQI